MQDSKLAELEKEVHTVQNECMEIRKYCDDIEKKVKSLNYDKQVLVQDSEFLDYELRDGKEQNI